MSGLCGWFCNGRGEPADAAVIGAMATTLNRFDHGTAHIAATAFGAVASAAVGTDANTFHNGELVVAVWGSARFTDADLDKIAQGDGIARAFALGYERRREDVFAPLA